MSRHLSAPFPDSRDHSWRLPPRRVLHGDIPLVAIFLSSLFVLWRRTFGSSYHLTVRYSDIRYARLGFDLATLWVTPTVTRSVMSSTLLQIPAVRSGSGWIRSPSEPMIRAIRVLVESGEGFVCPFFLCVFYWLALSATSFDSCFPFYVLDDNFFFQVLLLQSYFTATLDRGSYPTCS